MSVYRDTQGSVTFSHPIASALTATVKDAAGAVQYTSDPITSIPDFTVPGQNLFNADIPWTLTQYDADYTITWSDGAGFSREQSFQVVTPIVSLDRLVAVYPDQYAAFGDLQDLERTIRRIIQSYCGQVFGYSVGTQTYVGNGTGKIVLKQHCSKLMGALGGYGMYPSDWVAPDGSTNVNGELNLERAATIEDGWSLLFNWPTYLDVREAPPMELIQFTPAQDGTIRVPRHVWRERDLGVQYQIYGAWGYEAVPEDVQQAALLLANDYIAGDSEYRDRYLSILKIQQDSFTYHPGAFRGTGNARADLLLGPYRRQMGMTII